MVTVIGCRLLSWLRAAGHVESCENKREGSEDEKGAGAGARRFLACWRESEGGNTQREEKEEEESEEEETQENAKTLCDRAVVWSARPCGSRVMVDAESVVYLIIVYLHTRLILARGCLAVCSPPLAFPGCSV